MPTVFTATANGYATLGNVIETLFTATAANLTSSVATNIGNAFPRYPTVTFDKSISLDNYYYKIAYTDAATGISKIAYNSFNNVIDTTDMSLYYVYTSTGALVYIYPAIGSTIYFSKDYKFRMTKDGYKISIVNNTLFQYPVHLPRYMTYDYSSNS